MKSDANVELIKKACIAFDDGDEEAFASCVAEGWLEHRWSGDANGLDHVRLLIRELRQGFTDLHTEFHSIVADESTVACHYTISGIHSGTFFGAQATGTRVVVNEMLFSSVEDGRLRETWAMTDSVGLMEQIKAG